MKNYTKEELMQEFGDTELTLESYFKYAFGYSGIKDNKVIYVSVGGSSDEIYRFEPIIKGVTLLNKISEEIEINHAIITENASQVGIYHGQ